MTNAINNENDSSRQIPSLESCQSTVHKIACVKVFKYKMCINHCIAFTGKLSESTRCFLCGSERHESKDKEFSILSPAQLITKRFHHKEFCKLMRYKKDVQLEANGISDIWNSKIIHKLKHEEIIIDGKRTGHKHFEDFRESAFALASDVINVFKTQKKSSWPILLIDYNLPPSLRTKKAFIIHVGIVPGKCFH